MEARHITIMGKPAKITLATVAALVILTIGVYGNFLPMRKSQILIGTLRDLRDSESVQDFKDNLAIPLNFPSPIGQEEAVRNVANVILGIIQQTKDPQVVADFIAFIEDHYKPIISRGVGMSFEQNLYLLGILNEMALVKTKDTKFLGAAHNYFEQGLRLGPKRPQFLYGMFDIYRIEGNVDGAKAIANQILAQWPTDEKVKSGLEEFLRKVASSTEQKK